MFVQRQNFALVAVLFVAAASSSSFDDGRHPRLTLDAAFELLSGRAQMEPDCLICLRAVSPSDEQQPQPPNVDPVANCRDYCQHMGRQLPKGTFFTMLWETDPSKPEAPHCKCCLPHVQEMSTSAISV